MDAKTEIAIYKCLAQNSEDLISTWKSIASAEVAHHNRTKAMAWEIMGRGVVRENSYGDASEVVLDINDWRELCDVIHYGE